MNKIFSIQSYSFGRGIDMYLLGIHIRIKKFPAFSDLFNYKKAIADIVAQEYEIMSDVQDLHSKVFPRFRNINQGKSVVIIGSGPTLKYYSNEMKGINIALNKSLFLDDITFDYSFVVDINILKTCPNYLQKIKTKNCIKFVGKSLHPEGPGFPELLDGEKENLYRFYSSNPRWLYSKGSHNIIYPNIAMHPLYDRSTIAHPAIHFALYTHPEKIYLVGLDTCNNGHFFDGKNRVNKSNFSNMLKGYIQIKYFAKLHYPDVDIISVNPIGLKGLFKDVYTKSFVETHPELLRENIEIIK